MVLKHRTFEDIVLLHALNLHLSCFEHDLTVFLLTKTFIEIFDLQEK